MCRRGISVLQSGTAAARPEAASAGIGKADALHPGGGGQPAGTSRRGSADRRDDRSGEGSLAIQEEGQSHHQVGWREEAATPEAVEVTAGLDEATCPRRAWVGVSST